MCVSPPAAAAVQGTDVIMSIPSIPLAFTKAFNHSTLSVTAMLTFDLAITAVVRSKLT